MATTAVGATSSVTRTVSATVAGVSPGPPKSSEWHTSRPAALAAAVDARRSAMRERLAEAGQHVLGGRVDAEVHGGAAGRAQQPEHVRVTHARLQVAGEGDVRERGSGPAATPEQLLADRRHVALLRVERGVHDELLGGAELPAQPLHLVGDRLGGAPPQAGALETRVRAVHAAVRAAARRLHAGGAIPPGAGEHAGEIGGKTDAAQIVEREVDDACRKTGPRRAVAQRPRRRRRRRRRRAARGGSRGGRSRTPGRRGRSAPAARPRAPRPRHARTSPRRCVCAARRRCRHCAARARPRRGARPPARPAAPRGAAGRGPRRRRGPGRRRPPPPRPRRAPRRGRPARGTARGWRRR